MQAVIFRLGIWLLCFAPLLSYAQDDLNIHGVVSDAMTSKKLDGVKVTVTKNGTNHDSFTTRANGKYEFYLDCDARYKLIFQKDGYVDRSIVIDASNVPPEVVGAGIIMPTDMSMYEITPAMEGSDLSVFDKPIGKAKYDPEQGDLVWDFTYTNKIKGDITSFMHEVEKKQKELDKQASDADKAAKEQEEKFKQFVEDGDNDMSKSHYQDAVLNYQAALAIKPDNLEVKGKLGDAQTKYNNEKAAAEKEAAYASALDAGDGFMRTEEYSKAIDSYNEALTLKPNESYPQDQIDEANRIVKEREENLAKQDKFNKLMGEGETAFNAKEYEDALGKYQEAKLVFPDNKEVSDKIDATQEAIANKAKMAKLQADYDALIASADEKFKADNYKDALTDYQAAKDILPDETYPAEQIAACETKISEKEAAAEKQESFDALIKEGDEAVASADFETGIEKFTEALGIFPNNADAIAKRKDAQSLLDEKNAQAKKQENYDALISDADDLYNDENYAEAKAKYQEAKDLIPEETYPTAQITKIDAKLKELADAKESQDAYDAAMAAGKAAEGKKEYGEAINQYQAALAVFADDKDAADALENAKALKTEYEKNQATQEKYDNLIASADEKFGSEKYEDARSDYQAALEVKPDEDYPKGQLELIDTAIAEREKEAAAAAEEAKIQAEYEGYMTAGDKAMQETDFAEAINQYEEALNVKDGDEAATAKLKDAREQLALKESKMELDDQYNTKIEQADKNLKDNKLEDALAGYRAASELKESEQYPKDQIALVEERIANEAAAAAEAEKQAKIEQVNALVLEGDKLVNDKAFEKGIVKYEAALSIMPDREDVAAKRDKAMKDMLNFQESEANKEAYDAAIEEGDKQFGKENWKDAKTAYQNALDIKAGEQYPKDKIAAIDEKIASEEKAAQAAKQAELQEQFDDLISDGDKSFKRMKYHDALDSYQSALEILPGNEVAMQKIGEVNELLGQLDAAKDAQEKYDSLIAEGDELFDEESYEMARLKYLDAKELKPDEKYPPKRITEIDLQLEKQRLAEAQAEAAAKDKEYNDAVQEGDTKMADEKYDDAIDAYNDALTIKPDEVYPKGQIERIELLKEEKATEQANLERKAGQKKAAETTPVRKTEPTSNVNTNSENQAEQFMRDARDAQEKEKYQRIKKQKEQYAENNRSYAEESEAQREENWDHIKSFKSGVENQHKEVVADRHEKVENSVNYKKTLLKSQGTKAETEAVHRKDAYNKIVQDEENRSEWLADRQAQHEKEIQKQVDLKEEQLAKFQEWSNASVEERLNLSRENQEKAVQRYTENKVANDIREENAADFADRKSQILENRAEAANEDLEKVRKSGEELQEKQENYRKTYGSKNDNKVNSSAQQIKEQKESYQSALAGRQEMADKRREDEMEKQAALKSNQPKEYNEYYRSQLAENYPQGVSEESSTMGNKVIITRIVVRGNRGDEYKKVLDKAGNYYFKNGQSISENTWNRETIEAFNKSKD